MTEEEPEAEPEAESDDEEGEDVEVTEINILVNGKQKKFLIDKEKIMYDPETHEAIGLYNNGVIEN